MATKKKELSNGKEGRWTNEELKVCTSVLVSEEGFLVDLATRALKNSQTMTFQNILNENSTKV